MATVRPNYLFGDSTDYPGGFTPGLFLAETTMQSSVSQYGITWTFDSEYPVGQYVNGDYFVVDGGSGVTVSSISPGWDGSQNGSMLSARTGSGQGMDSTAAYGWDASLLVTAPVTIAGPESLLSAISAAPDSRPQFETIACLTVVDSVPSQSSFRPSFIGLDKTHYWEWADVNLNTLPTVSRTASAPADLSYHIRWSERPWTVWGPNWTGRYYMATQNAPSPSGYHRDLGRFLAEVSVLVIMDYPSEERNQLIANFIQLGIDYYAMATDQNGYGYTAYWAWPTLFAGLMLDEELLYNIYVDNRCLHTINNEGTRGDAMIYNVASDQLSTVTSSIVPSGKTWTGKDVAWRQSTNNSNCYEQEHLHPDEWGAVATSEGCSQGLGTRETYRRINSPAWVGMVSAGAAMDAQSYFPKPMLFDYVTRWMEEDLSDSSHDAYQGTYTSSAEEYGTSMSAYIDEFYNTHGLNPIT